MATIHHAKVSPTHTTVIADAVTVVRAAIKLQEVSKISFGAIKRGRTVSGSRSFKALIVRNAIRLSIRGVGVVQFIFVQTTSPSDFEKVIEVLKDTFYKTYPEALRNPARQASKEKTSKVSSLPAVAVKPPGNLKKKDQYSPPVVSQKVKPVISANKNGTCWALAFAPQASFLLRWVGTEKPMLLSFALVSENGFLQPEEVLVDGIPILDHFQAGDTLYAEMGGKNGPFLLRALERGVEIYQIPSYQLVENNVNDEIKEEPIEAFGKTERFERQALANRKKRVEQIARLAHEKPNIFYQMMPVDPYVWRISVYIDAYIALQKNFRIKAQQRHFLMKTDFTWLPASSDQKTLEKIQEMLADPQDVAYYERLEKQMMAAVAKELPILKIWTDFMEIISGIGPSVAGRLIAGIGNIKRFPKRGGFRAYCGFAVFNEEMQCFRRGDDEKHNFVPGMRQAFYLFGEQIVRQGEKNAYNAIYVAKKEEYLSDGKGRSKLHCYRMAVRAACSKFLNDLWAASWKIVEETGEALPDSVRHVIYPGNYHPRG